MEQGNNGDLSAEVVVIGGGGAGLAAAVTAMEEGARSVIVLESRRSTGGNSSLALGAFSVGGPGQKLEDLTNEIDGFFQKTMRYSHWRNNPRLVRALIEKACDFVPWLEGQGVEFEWDESTLVMPMYRVKGVTRGGATILKALKKRCEDLGVRIVCETRARKLLMDGAEKVTGVLAEGKSGQIWVDARSVVIATGGFAGNRELIKKYFPDFKEDDAVPLGGIPHQGDGLLMAREIGAGFDGLAFLEMSLFVFGDSRHLAILAKNADTLWVNRKGERFVNESIVWPEAANAVYRQPGKYFYSLFDEKNKQHLFNKPLRGLEKHSVSEGSWPDQAEKDLWAYTHKGRVKIGDSIEEMAEWIGVSPEILKKTIEEYNACCKMGHDIFIKDPRHLQPLTTPPFYGIRHGVSLLATHGDLRVNDHMEVLDKEDNAIPGLFAAGDDTGSVDSDTYNMDLPGHSFGFAINTGRIAGENAVKYTASD
jgi:fumarate reductase flavoprotein subunit